MTDMLTNADIWQRLQLIRDTLIQSHVKLNEAMDQIDKLAEEIRKQVDVSN